TVAQFNADGIRDYGFGTKGQAVLNFGGNADAIGGITLQDDGRIVVVGSSRNQSRGTRQVTSNFAVARLTAQGTLHPPFGTGGLVLTQFNNLDFASAVLVQRDGRVLVVGTTYNPVGHYADFAIAAYNPDGTLVSPARKKKK